MKVKNAIKWLRRLKVKNVKCVSVLVVADDQIFDYNSDLDVKNYMKMIELLSKQFYDMESDS